MGFDKGLAEESFKEHARRDPDFDQMRNDSEFRQAIGE